MDECTPGIRFGTHKINNIAYADDITLMASTAKGLQDLIDVCENYANDWRFEYNTDKTNSMLLYNRIVFNNLPKLYMYGKQLSWVRSATVLGCTFTSDCTAKEHVDNRILKCHKSFCGSVAKGINAPSMYVSCNI